MSNAAEGIISIIITKLKLNCIQQYCHHMAINT